MDTDAQEEWVLPTAQALLPDAANAKQSTELAKASLRRSLKQKASGFLQRKDKDKGKASLWKGNGKGIFKDWE